MSKHNLCSLLLALLIGCTSKPPSEIVQKSDTTRNYSTASAIVPEDRAPAVMDTTLKDADTLFNSLVKMEAVHGNFISVTRITENFIDASNLSSEKILPAFLILSGDGEYGGMHEGVAYQNLYSVLAV